MKKLLVEAKGDLKNIVVKENKDSISVTFKIGKGAGSVEDLVKYAAKAMELKIKQGDPVVQRNNAVAYLIAAQRQMDLVNTGMQRMAKK